MKLQGKKWAIPWVRILPEFEREVQSSSIIRVSCINSVQFNVVLFPLAVYLYCRFYADRPKFNEMIIIRYVILLSWCQNLPVCQFLSGWLTKTVKKTVHATVWFLGKCLDNWTSFRGKHIWHDHQIYGLKNHPDKHRSEIDDEPISGHGTDNGNLMWGWSPPKRKPEIQDSPQADRIKDR